MLRGDGGERVGEERDLSREGLGYKQKQKKVHGVFWNLQRLWTEEGNEGGSTTVLELLTKGFGGGEGGIKNEVEAGSGIGLRGWTETRGSVVWGYLSLWLVFFWVFSVCYKGVCFWDETVSWVGGELVRQLRTMCPISWQCK